jgi:hypothetical protein
MKRFPVAPGLLLLGAQVLLVALFAGDLLAQLQADGTTFGQVTPGVDPWGETTVLKEIANGLCPWLSTARYVALIAVTLAIILALKKVVGGGGSASGGGGGWLRLFGLFLLAGFLFMPVTFLDGLTGGSALSFYMGYWSTCFL